MTLLANALVLVTTATTIQVTPATPDCRTETELSLTTAWGVDLTEEQSRCLRIELDPGEFVRLSLRVDSGLVDLHLFEPGEQEPARVIAFGGGLRGPKQLSLEARVGGSHILSFSGLQLGSSPIVAQGVQVSVLEWESPAVRRARRLALETDPRIEWLERHAVSLDALQDGGNRVELSALDSILADKRVVHLGASYFDAGGDLQALSRLAQHLVESLGFGVILFESDIYGLHRTQLALDDGVPGSAALRRGLWDFLADSRQLQSLGEFLTSAEVRVAGFDFLRFASPTASAVVPDLRDLLVRWNIEEPKLSDGSSLTRALQDWIASVENGTEEAESSELSELSDTLDAVSTVADMVMTERDRIWPQIIRSTAARVRGFSVREEQMGRNLRWLVEDRFRDKRVLILGMTYHMIDGREGLPNASWAGPWPFTAGEWLRDEIEEDVYSIAATSYQGATRAATPFGRYDDVQADLSPLIEFEELMARTGMDLAIVDLRQAPDVLDWTEGEFVARILNQLPILASWSDHVDALLFLRDQFPSEQVSR